MRTVKSNVGGSQFELTKPEQVMNRVFQNTGFVIKSAAEACKSSPKTTTRQLMAQEKVEH